MLLAYEVCVFIKLSEKYCSECASAEVFSVLLLRLTKALGSKGQRPFKVFTF